MIIIYELFTILGTAEVSARAKTYTASTPPR